MLKYILIILFPFTCFGWNNSDIITATILAEARGEGQEGMFAVASVIAQRAINRKLTPAQVCLERKQFSCWNTQDPNRGKMRQLLETKEAEYARFLADNLNRIDLKWMLGADHYHAKGVKPYWAKKSKQVKVVGRHIFYKLKNS